jgi:omega-6 fatty acid desaturase (delta-12 desaturase)
MRGTLPTLRAAIAVIPPQCYANPTWKGLLHVARAAAAYGLLVAALVTADRVLALLFLWPLAGLCISSLFVLGHDAGHGALFGSPRLCRFVGTVTLLPALHAYSVWVLGHNHIHHVHSGRDGIDFVWHPLTPGQYAALPRIGRLWHRLEWSAFGAGPYYLRAIWWGKMMRLVPPPRHVAAFRRDRRLVAAYAAASSLACAWIGWHGGGLASAAVWMWFKVWLMPWLFWNYFIGATVYLHHIAPETTWSDGRRWSRFRGQVLATTNYVVPGWYNAFAHNIYLHVPHHVDSRIPFYGLPLAAAALARHFGPYMQTRPLGLRDYLQVTRHCKLYDFEREVWCGYGDRVPAPVTRLTTVLPDASVAIRCPAPAPPP